MGISGEPGGIGEMGVNVGTSLLNFDLNFVSNIYL